MKPDQTNVYGAALTRRGFVKTGGVASRTTMQASSR